MKKYKPRIIASIEARMNSSRLPGKVLMDVMGKPALSHLLHRLKQCEYLDDIILATTLNSQDDLLEAWAIDNDVRVYRGSEEDVLHRVVKAHEQMQSDLIVEITGDCILLDPEIIDLGIETFIYHDCDVVTNTLQPSFPMGIDVQVYPFEQLQWVEKNVSDVAVREHVSLYFYENPEKYSIINLLAPRRWRMPKIRFQLDYPEDLQFIQYVYQNLEPMYGEGFGIEEIKNLLSNKPELLKINANCIEKPAR